MHSKEYSWWCCVSKCPRRLRREAGKDAGGYRYLQYDGHRLNSKQESCRTVCLHKPALSLSLLMGQKQREKRSDGFYLHCGLRSVCSAIPAGMCHVHTKKTPKKPHLVIQTVFKISSADQKKKYFVDHLWIMKGLFHFQPRHISSYLFIYLTSNTIMRYSSRVCSLPIWLIPKDSSCIFWICLFLLCLTQY